MCMLPNVHFVKVMVVRPCSVASIGSNAEASNSYWYYLARSTGLYKILQPATGVHEVRVGSAAVGVTKVKVTAPGRCIYLGSASCNDARCFSAP